MIMKSTKRKTSTKSVVVYIVIYITDINIKTNTVKTNISFSHSKFTKQDCSKQR